MTFDLQSASASEAKSYVRTNVYDGVRCPCCEQYAKVYKRTVNSAMARLLIWLHRKSQQEYRWYNIHEFPLIQGRRGGGDFAKLAYWGLVKSYDQEVENGTQSSSPYSLGSGRWKIVPDGSDFVANTALIRKYANVYNGKLLGLSGDMIGISTCLGTHFSLEELMNE